MHFPLPKRDIECFFYFEAAQLRDRIPIPRNDLSTANFYVGNKNWKLKESFSCLPGGGMLHSVLSPEP